MSYLFAICKNEVEEKMEIEKVLDIIIVLTVEILERVFKGSNVNISWKGRSILSPSFTFFHQTKCSLSISIKQ